MQANAILDMRLYKLIGLEIDVLMKEHEETLKNIARYTDILNNYGSMAEVIIKELDQFKKEFGRPRRTMLENAGEIVLEEQKIEAMPGRIFDGPLRLRAHDRRERLRAQQGGRRCGEPLCAALHEHGPRHVFTDTGKVHLLKLIDVPYGRFRDKGTPLDNLCNYSSSEEQFVTVMAMNDIRDTVLTFVTKQAMVKRVEGKEFDVVSKRTIQATKLQEGDTVLAVHAASEQAHIVLASENSFFLASRFPRSRSRKKRRSVCAA